MIKSNCTCCIMSGIEHKLRTDGKGHVMHDLIVFCPLMCTCHQRERMVTVEVEAK